MPCRYSALLLLPRLVIVVLLLIRIEVVEVGVGGGAMTAGYTISSSIRAGPKHSRMCSSSWWRAYASSSESRITTIVGSSGSDSGSYTSSGAAPMGTTLFTGTMVPEAPDPPCRRHGALHLRRTRRHGRRMCRLLG